MLSRRLAVLLWVMVVVACGVAASRVTLRTDMTAFLPRSAAPGQQALAAQVNNGAASRLVLLAIEGAPPPVLAALSRSLARRLRAQPGLIGVANGDADSFAGVSPFVWDHRYLLSDGVTTERFTTAGLRAALETDLGLLGTDLGGLLQASLPADPTGEALRLMGQFQGGPGPRRLEGVWFSRDGARALLLVTTAAPGFDIDAQSRDLAAICAAFRQMATAGARLLESGPGVFAVHIRDTTRSDVTWLSLLATAGAAGLLLFTYRSPRVLLLGLLPVATGSLVAIAAVSVAFGFVHGVTLGFGVALIGESIDYAIYLFTQTAPDEKAGATLARIWPTLRLGAGTSIAGFAAMLFSDVTGFAQLGLFSIAGLLAAAGVTRFVLPQLAPREFFAPGSQIMARPLLTVIRHRVRLRPVIAAAVLLGCGALALHRGALLDQNLAHLSPIPPAEQALDRALRDDLGVPDQRYFAVFHAGSEQEALQHSEALAPILQALVPRRQLRGFDLPSEILPSAIRQRQRQDALPDDATLRARLAEASAGLPFRPDAFAAFFPAVAEARAAPLLTASSLPPALALRLQSLAVDGGDGWTVVAPLHGVADPAAVAQALPQGVAFVDIDQEQTALLNIFQRDAVTLAGAGSLAILAVVLAGLRAPGRVAAVAAPLAAAVVVTAALLTLDGHKLSIFMLVGFLLICALGSNYCLFFERRQSDPGAGQRALAAILLANLCTVSAYGLMSCSRIPVLHDIGMTVAIGTLLSLLFGAVLSTPRQSGMSGFAAETPAFNRRA